MISIKPDKITAIWLLMVVIISVGYTTFPGIIAERREASVSLAVSQPPKVGEVFTVSFTFTLKVPPESAYTYPHKVRFNINTFPEKDAYEIVNGQLENKLPQLSKGIPVTFNISAIITKPVIRLQIIGSIPGRGAWGKSREFYLIDPETGQYGTKEEYNKNLPLTWRYDPADGIWLEEGEAGYAEWNRRIITTAKALEPALSDSEALCLHADIVNENTPYQCSGPILPGKSSVTEEELFDFLLKRGWLEKHRAGEMIKKEWLKQLSEENKRKVEELQEKENWKK